MKIKILVLLMTMVTVALHAQTFTVLHSFDDTDGNRPSGGLVAVGNKLYGTTLTTIFSVNADGSDYNVLHTFTGGTNDGYWAQGNLILAGETLYGTTVGGGASGCGTIYSISTNGTSFTVLHSFDSSDQEPQAGLALSSGILYGTTWGEGKIFALNLNVNPPVYTVLHSGDALGASLVISGDKLFGTSYYGGGSGDGVIFSLDVNDTNSFQVLHTFTNNPDGALPVAGMVLGGNTLYGTTTSGGDNGKGSVFSLNLDGGTYTVLYSFTATNSNFDDEDGYEFGANLILHGNKLYGTTVNFGSSSVYDAGYNGTVYSLNTDGSNFKLLYIFADTDDGSHPIASVILSSNLLYGTTQFGGVNGGYGTVYSLELSTPTFTSAVILAQDQEGYIFYSGATYYISNSISISGETVIQGGAVIKYAPGTKITVDVLDCETTSNNPAIFTARDDDTVGVTLSDSTHSPSGYYGDSGLEIDTETAPFVHDIKVYHASWGLNFINTSGYDIDDGVDLTYTAVNVTIQNCGNGIEFGIDNGNNSLCITNLVMSDVGGIATGYMLTGGADHCTFNNVGGLCGDPDGYGFYGFNFSSCTFSNVTLNAFEVDVDGDNNGFHGCSNFGDYDDGGTPDKWLDWVNYFGSDWYLF